MKERTFTLKQIERAIEISPKFSVERKIPPEIDGDLDTATETIEADMFLYILLGSNMEEFQKYKKLKQ